MKSRWLPILGVVLVLIGLLGASITSAVLSAGSAHNAWLRDDWSRLDDDSDPALEDQDELGGTDSRYRDGSMDAMFLEQMVPHHEDAVAMARIALERSRRPEIRSLAQDVVRVQTAEIEEMRDLYREYYGGEITSETTGSGGFRRPNRRPGGRGMMGRGMMSFGPEALEELRTAEDVDRTFIEMMVPHHRMGIMMARMAGASTERDQIRQLTDSIVRSQSAEIRDMVGWYREWYGG